jgi:RimJ/RimL family protein N-acetyltransferase
VSDSIELERICLERLDEALASDIVSDRRRDDFAESFPTPAERRVSERVISSDPGALRPPFCVYVIRELEGGQLVGSAGFHGVPRERVAEIGYGLVPSRWGRGLALEAVRGLLDAARASGEVDRVVATVDERNSASMSVLRRSGFSNSSEVPSSWSIVLG